MTQEQLEAKAYNLTRTLAPCGDLTSDQILEACDTATRDRISPQDLGKLCHMVEERLSLKRSIKNWMHS